MNATQHRVKTVEPVEICWGSLNAIALETIMEDNAKWVSVFSSNIEKSGYQFFSGLSYCYRISIHLPVCF